MTSLKIIDSIRVQNYRSILDSGEIELNQITVLIGKNNSGKSALLRAIHFMQQESNVSREDLRKRSMEFTLDIKFSNPEETLAPEIFARNIKRLPNCLYRIKTNFAGTVMPFIFFGTNESFQIARFSSNRKLARIVSVFAKRKPERYGTELRREYIDQLSLSDSNISSLLQSLVGDHSDAKRYRQILGELLPGLELTVIPAEVGAAPGMNIPNGESLSLERMGEGVSGLLRLITEFALGIPRVYLIEEPETDLHPSILAKLLDLIIEESSKGSQFIISTHSDQVLKHLGIKGDTNVYEVVMDFVDEIPTSRFTPINNAFDRKIMLSGLGFTDIAPTPWLLLEEGTAQTFIGKLLIPLFIPELSLLRIVSATGAHKLTTRAEALFSSVLFMHLDPKGQIAFVLADGDEEGVKAVNRLKGKFTDWNESSIRNLGEKNIEKYYPERFRDEVERVLSIRNPDELKDEKTKLVKEVIEWALSNEELARVQLSASSAEIIEYLNWIRSEIKDLWHGVPNR